MTPEQIEAERALFEAAFRALVGIPQAQLYRRDFPDSNRLGQYVAEYIECAWQMWQAAKADAVPAGWVAWHGDYEKQQYDVWVNGCDVVMGCWPNAGFMSATDGTGRNWGARGSLGCPRVRVPGRVPRTASRPIKQGAES